MEACFHKSLILIHFMHMALLCFIHLFSKIHNYTYIDGGPGSSVGIATDYRLDGRGSNLSVVMRSSKQISAH
jgi:hypothetical protein